MEVKILEYRESEVVERLQKTLNEAFSPISMKFDVKYFIGEEIINKDKVLCILISSSKAGIIYERIVIMKSYQTPMDVEEDFIGGVMTDITLAGVTFLNIEKIKMTNPLFDKNKIKDQTRMN